MRFIRWRMSSCFIEVDDPRFDIIGRHDIHLVRIFSISRAYVSEENNHSSNN